jgi:hypothetical protein
LFKELHSIQKLVRSDPSKHKEYEPILCDLCDKALQFYKDDKALNLSKFYYEYGSLIVLKLESSTDVFGALF